MNNPETQERIKNVKIKIEKLIEEGNLTEAKNALEKYDEKMPGDPDICSMRAVIEIIEGSLDKAESILLNGLQEDSVQYDLMYNLAYIREQQGQYLQAADLYSRAATVADSDERKRNVDDSLERLRAVDSGIEISEKARIVFFVKKGMDNFLGNIINGLSDQYWVRKIIVSDFKQIDTGVAWADVCWFEWCDELVAYGSRLPLAQQKKIICRLHSYEAFSEQIFNVVWDKIDRVIFVAEHIRRFVLDKQRKLRHEQTVVIPNGIDIDSYTYKDRNAGFNVAYVGYINYKKGPMLLLHTFKALYDKDNRYRLYIAGKFQDYRDELYFEQMKSELGIENSVFYEGWQNDVNQWLEDKNYILCTSVLESQNLSVMQAMCKGIKPVVHNFVGAREIYEGEFIWNTMDEAVKAITKGSYESRRYRSFVRDKYSLELQIESTSTMISELLSFRKLIELVSSFLSGEKKPQELMRDDLTVLIPCYNRAKMLKEDLDRGFKLGNQPKLIVDDCSTAEAEWLEMIEKDLQSLKSKLIRKDRNAGVAESRRCGLEAIETKYTTFIDDDNMMVCIDRAASDREISQLTQDVSIVVPRYIINYYSDRLSLGYDRQGYNNLNGAQILKNLAFSGEMMGLLTGGAIGETLWMSKYAYCPLFRVSEDFVMLTRMMASKPEMKVRTAEGLVFIRRFLDEGSTMNPSPQKLMLSLFSQAIACYYCLKLGVADKDEVLKWMKDRAAVIQRLYNFGESFEMELIAYLMGEISEEVFSHFIALHGLKLDDGLDELAPELRMMRAMFYKEPKAVKWFAGMKDLPLVSIIIPTFNRRDMLKRAIDQVLKQDYPNIEVIVTDNCSEDGTEEMVRSNYKDEKKLIYHRNEKNIGPVLNCMNGFYNLSKGKYCIITFDDDYFIDSDYISNAALLLEKHKNITYVFGGLYYNNSIKGEVRRDLARQPQIVDGLDFFINFKSVKYPIMPSINTIIFRRETAIEHKCLGTLPNACAGDRYFQYKLLLQGDVGFTNRIAVVYNLHDASMSLNLGNRVTIKDDDAGDKSLLTAIDDDRELKVVYKLALDKTNIGKEILDIWLQNKAFSYFYWRFNETVQTNQELEALLAFVKKEYPDFYKAFKSFTDEKYDRQN